MTNERVAAIFFFTGTIAATFFLIAIVLVFHFNVGRRKVFGPLNKTAILPQVRD